LSKQLGGNPLTLRQFKHWAGR